MPDLSIPKQHRNALVQIGQLPDRVIDRLVEALAKAPHTMNRLAIKTSIEQQDLQNSSDGNLTAIVETILALYVVRTKAEKSVEAFVRDVIEALASDQPEPEWTSEWMQVLGDRLRRLMKVVSLDTAAKAIALRSEFPNTFCDAKILTDLRSVFGDDPKARPTGAIITQTLKLEYHHDGDHREFFVALDVDDLAKLEEIIARAKDKAVSLRSVLENANIPELDN
jgi:hypothetical protein